MNARARSEKQRKVRGRRRARATMRNLTGICALAALGIGATELTSTGLQAFIERPAGVGATPATATPATAPQGRSATPNNGSGSVRPRTPEAPPVQVEHAPCRQGADDIGPRPQPRDRTGRREPTVASATRDCLA